MRACGSDDAHDCFLLAVAELRSDWRHLNRADRGGAARGGRLLSRGRPSEAPPSPLAQCHGFDSRADPAAVTVGDHRTVCFPQPALLTDDRRLAVPDFPERTQRPGGVASENPSGREAAPVLQRTRRGVAAGSRRQLCHEGRAGDGRLGARRFGVLRCPDVRPVTSTEPSPAQDTGLALASLRLCRRG